MGMFGDSREYKLPSGRTLLIEPADFETSKELFEVVAKELHSQVKFSNNDDELSVAKDALCAAIYSQDIQRCIKKCFKHCTIDKMTIDENTFQKVDFRKDYYLACLEVATDNINPLGSPLSQEFSGLLAKMLARLVLALQKIIASSTSSSQNSDTAGASPAK